MSAPRSHRIRSAPSAASRTACERPWPRAAPVTIATLPVKRGRCISARRPLLRGDLLAQRGDGRANLLAAGVERLHLERGRQLEARAGAEREPLIDRAL